MKEKSISDAQAIDIGRANKRKAYHEVVVFLRSQEMNDAAKKVEERFLSDK